MASAAIPRGWRAVTRCRQSYHCRPIQNISEHVVYRWTFLLSVPAGGPPVSVHPGLQGFVQADVGAVLAGAVADPGREGSLREDRPAPVAEERHRVRDQGPAVLQRVPGNGQRIEDGEDLGRA